MRVWRDWLKDVSLGGCGKKEEERGLLWMDSRKKVGLRVKVVDHSDAVAPAPPARMHEDLPVNYTLQYEGEFCTIQFFVVLGKC